MKSLRLVPSSTQDQCSLPH
uniref:AsnS2 n=1 Tax=Arundo donax TaxID=35708 RepID=A0A0A8YF45_ARUDO